jgi:acyl carrier protein
MTEPAVSAPAGQQGRTEADVRAVVRAVVIELSPERDESAGPDAHLIDDLAYNSLALVELAFTLEDEFDLSPIEEAVARQITTLRAVQEHVVAELRTRGEVVTP